MKKVAFFALCAIIVLTFSSCGKSTDTINNDSTTLTESESIGSSGILDMVDYFNDVQSIGTSLFDCFSDFNNLDNNTKFKRIKEAESYTESMHEKYTAILKLCQGNQNWGNIEYQIRLLDHLIPQPIKNNSQSISNATVLYQMYFQQISSSFSYISEDIEHISNGEPLENRLSYYDKISKMPKPDTIIYGVSFISEETEDGAIKYTYNSGNDETEAQMNYNLYLIALGMDTGLTLQFDNTVAYVFDGDNMVSALMAGTDADIGHFFMVSFPQ